MKRIMLSLTAMMVALHGREGVGLVNRKVVSMPRIVLFATMLSLLMWLAIPTPASAQGVSPNIRADFNGDGFADLAVGVTGEDDGAGGVNVIYGSDLWGPATTGNQFWNQGSPAEIEGMVESEDFFGNSLAAGDFDDDGFADLAVGVREEETNEEEPNSGGVNVIYGSATGLTSAGNQFWNQDSDGIENAAERYDYFAWSLATGDFDDDRYADLAVGVPFEDYSAGGVNVIYGSAGGLIATGNEFWNQNTGGTDGIKGTKESGDRFGFSLAAGDFGKFSGVDDLAVGVPWEDTNATSQGADAGTDAGGVNVIYGTHGGLIRTGNQFWNQDSDGIENVHYWEGDQFGISVAAGNLGKGAEDDLMVGVPFDDTDYTSAVGGHTCGQPNPFDDCEVDDGGVNVMYGSAAGLTASGDQFWTQDSDGDIGFHIEGASEDGDLFGRSVAADDFNGNGYADLVVGVPTESTGQGSSARDKDGVVNVIPGSVNGLTGAGNKYWNQARGLEGTAESNDRFGSSLDVGWR